ncbi:MAG: hypothetical protein KBT06_04495 [Prevotellaceae bacterium]|nr:hypothetical protein [Candidatus Colivivens equi]
MDIQKDAILFNLKRITNLIFKILPNREEGGEWRNLLSTLLEELAGMDRLFLDKHTTFFTLICKLEGLYFLSEEEDFYDFRRTIFECLSLMEELRKYVEQFG